IELKATILKNGTAYLENDKMTMKTLVDLFLKTKENSWKPETKKSYEYCLNHVIRLLGSKRLSTLTSSVYEREFINKLVSEKLKNGTIRQIHKSFIVLINFAVADDLLTKNKFKGIKIPTDDKLTNFLEPS